MGYFEQGFEQSWKKRSVVLQTAAVITQQSIYLGKKLFSLDYIDNYLYSVLDMEYMTARTRINFGGKTQKVIASQY